MAQATDHSLIRISEAKDDDKHETPPEDPVPKILEKALIGTAAVNIRHLDPDWTRDDARAEPNRPLDDEHVRKLAQNMASNLMIADAGNRICISMSRDEYARALSFTARCETYHGYENRNTIDHFSAKFQQKVDERAKEIDQKIREKVSGR
jgi:uncharacterized heparinase superfamily protein